MSTTEHPDPYMVLGVPRTATSADITRAYRALLRATHPDTRDPTASADPGPALAQALDAYALLHDPDRRTAYDHQHPTRPPATTGATFRPRRQPPIQAGPVHWTPNPRP
ncbi:J domain-containing protein [Microbacterium kribbense]